MLNTKRNVIAYKRYFLDFYGAQTNVVQVKIEWTVQLIRVTKNVPLKYFKHIAGVKGLYEIRVEAASNIFRVFAFFDKDHILVLVNGFQKKSQKTPKSELEKAIKIMKEYQNEKNR